MIMPLTRKKRFGISYLCQPLICQQLGVFSTIHHAPFCIDDFIEAIPSKFKLIDIAINSMNYLSPKNHFGKITQVFNQELPLSDRYEDIRSRYKASHVKNLEKFTTQKLKVEISGDTLDHFLKHKFDFFSKKGVEMSDSQRITFTNLLKYLDAESKIDVVLGFDNQHVVIGGACFIFLEGSVLIQTFSNDIGRKSGLIFFLIDDFVRKNAGRELILDFMGSSITGINYRNAGFGCVDKEYTFLSIDRLPPLVRFFRKRA
jgi:hypothetical protein